MLMVVLQLVSLFLGIWFTEVNVMKWIRGHPVPMCNFIIQSAALVTFIYVTFLR